MSGDGVKRGGRHAIIDYCWESDGHRDDCSASALLARFAALDERAGS